MNWEDLVGQLYGQTGTYLVEQCIAHGAAVAEAGYPMVLPPFTMDLIARLALNGETEPKPKPRTPIDAIETLPWNHSAAYPFPSTPRSLADIHYLTVHHSGTTPRDQTAIEDWNAYHTQTKSWSHVGYHFAIAAMTPVAEGGAIDLYQTNHMAQITWHDSSNYRTLGMVLAGDLRAGHDGEPNELQIDLWGQFTAWLLPQLPNLKGIVPHSFFQATACPGDWERWVPKLAQSSADWGQNIMDLVYNVQPARMSRALSRVRTFAPLGWNELAEAQKDV